MKINSRIINGNAVKSLICFFVSLYLISLLFSWNKVPHYRNFIFISHPMSINSNDKRHYAQLDATITLFNSPMETPGEQYYFKISDKEKNKKTNNPQISTIDTLGALFCPLIVNKRNVPQGIQYLCEELAKYGRGTIYNTFSIIKFSYPYSQKIDDPTHRSHVGDKGADIVIEKKNIFKDAKYGSWSEEYECITFMEEFKKWDEKELDKSFFYFQENQMQMNTYYGLDTDPDGEVYIKSQQYNGNQLLNKFKTLFADYDISKAEYSLSLIANEIDSVNLIVNFDEGVEVSEITTKTLISKGIHYIKLSNIGVDLPQAMYEMFMPNINQVKKKVTIKNRELSDYKQNGTLSFSVNYLESKNLQWIRLFFLTSIITYLIVASCRYAILCFKY